MWFICPLPSSSSIVNSNCLSLLFQVIYRLMIWVRPVCHWWYHFFNFESRVVFLISSITIKLLLSFLSCTILSITKLVWGCWFWAVICTNEIISSIDMFFFWPIEYVFGFIYWCLTSSIRWILNWSSKNFTLPILLISGRWPC